MQSVRVLYSPPAKNPTYIPGRVTPKFACICAKAHHGNRFVTMPVARPWSPPTEMPVPTWKVDECAQAARALHVFMQDRPHLQLAVECFDHYERLQLTCAVMNVIGQELNIEETLSKEGTFESIMSALSLNEEPQGMLDEFHIEGEHGKSGNWRRMVWQCGSPRWLWTCSSSPCSCPLLCSSRLTRR